MKEKRETPNKRHSIQEAFDWVEKAEQGLDDLAMRMDSFMSLNLQTAEIYQYKFKFAAGFVRLFISYLSVAKDIANSVLEQKGGDK